jgi:hypothetical protein
MTKERSLTRLELLPAFMSGQPGWVDARWRRADGSKGSVFAAFRPKGPDRWYISQLLVHVPTGALLRDIPLHRIETAANADPDIRAWVDPNAELMTEAKRMWARRSHKLKRPAKRLLDDAFYERVAAAYREAVAFGQPPAKTLAEDSDTPPGTVNRWIAEARNRGYLPPAEPGKVSA